MKFKTFTEWMEALAPQRLGSRQYGPYDPMYHTNQEESAFREAIHDVLQGMHNSLANATPERGFQIDFAHYLNILSDAAQQGHGKQYARGLSQAIHLIQASAQKFVEARREANFQWEGFQEAMKPVWILWGRARDILQDIFQKADKSTYYTPTPGRY